MLVGDECGEDEVDFLVPLDRGGRQFLAGGGELLADGVRLGAQQLHGLPPAVWTRLDHRVTCFLDVNDRGPPGT